MRDAILQSMPPVGAADARLLILGSLPGAASLAAGRYYDHPRNQFWPLLGDAIGEPLAGLPYAGRLACLDRHGIALWDVIGSARRRGSLDAAIRDAVPNRLSELIAAHPRLGAIAFNGGAAARIGRAAVGEAGGIALIDLPSSSPAYTLPLDAKQRAWRVLGPLARAGKTATLGR